MTQNKKLPPDPLPDWGFTPCTVGPTGALQRLPYTPDGDIEFVEILLNYPGPLSDELRRLLADEAKKRSNIHESIWRYILLMTANR